MILRRIAAALKRQDWATVFVEFALVVVGVLIALQLDNWNDARKERKLERAYLNRLYIDLEKSREDAQSDFAFVHDAAEDATFILNSLRSCNVDPDDLDRFATGLFRLGKLTLPNLVDTALEEMKSTGALGVLREPGLIEELVELQRLFTADTRSAAQVETWSTNQLVILHSRIGFEIEATRSGAGPVAWEELDFDFTAACQDVTLQNAISAIRMYSFDIARRNKRAEGRIEKAQERVAAALDRRSPGWREQR